MENALKEWRKSANLTQTGVADLLGISRSSFRDIERGAFYPSFQTAVTIEIQSCGAVRVETWYPDLATLLTYRKKHGSDRD